MQERIQTRKEGIEVSDVRRELPRMTDDELIDLLDALRVAERKPTDKKSLDEALIVLEARRRAQKAHIKADERMAYILNEAADAVEKEIAKAS